MLIAFIDNKVFHILLVVLYMHRTFTATSPSSFSVSPRKADNKDDFPLPTGPTTATRDPSGMSKVMLK